MALQRAILRAAGELLVSSCLPDGGAVVTPPSLLSLLLLSASRPAGSRASRHRRASSRIDAKAPRPHSHTALPRTILSCCCTPCNPIVARVRTAHSDREHGELLLRRVCTSTLPHIHRSVHPHHEQMHVIDVGGVRLHAAAGRAAVLPFGASSVDALPGRAERGRRRAGRGQEAWRNDGGVCMGTGYAPPDRRSEHAANKFGRSFRAVHIPRTHRI
jgi:hypothetical protein